MHELTYDPTKLSPFPCDSDRFSWMFFARSRVKVFIKLPGGKNASFTRSHLVGARNKLLTFSEVCENDPYCSFELLETVQIIA